MKNYRFIICLLFCAFFIIPGSTDAQETFKVRWVIDGDTVVLVDGRHVRYIGINAPEVDSKHQNAEPYGYQAKKYNAGLVSSKALGLQFDKERYDRFGRLLAYIFLSDGTFINKAMIAQGYAYFLPRKPNVRYHKMLLHTQREAMSAQKGIWQKIRAEEGGYLGNRRSQRFHANTCPFGKKISPTNRVYFKSKWDAFWAGFAPGKKCLAGKAANKQK